MRPRVTLARDEAVQEGNGAGLVAAGLVLEPSGKRRCMSEIRARRKHAPDLEVRIDAGIEHAKQFQDQTVAIDDRRVGLLGPECMRLAWAFAIATQLAP